MRFVIFATIFMFALPVGAQTNNLQEACKSVQMDCSYNHRYEVIDAVFTASGQIMFDGRSKLFTHIVVFDGPQLPARLPRNYVGTSDQNAKLARNIMANKALFVSGKLTLEAAKRWKLVR